MFLFPPPLCPCAQYLDAPDAEEADDNTKTEILFLFNALIDSFDALEDRIALRNELINLKLLPTLDRLEDAGASVDLATQIDTFRDSMAADDKQMSFQSVSLGDPHQVAELLKTTLRVTPAYPWFVKIMQLLLSLPSKGEVGAQAWRVMEHVIREAVLPGSVGGESEGVGSDGGGDGDPFERSVASSAGPHVEDVKLAQLALADREHARAVEKELSAIRKRNAVLETHVQALSGNDEERAAALRHLSDEAEATRSDLKAMLDACERMHTERYDALYAAYCRTVDAWRLKKNVLEKRIAIAVKNQSLEERTSGVVHVCVCVCGSLVGMLASSFEIMVALCFG